MKTLLLFISLFIISELSAQSVVDTNNIISDKTNLILKRNAQSLISFVLKDSMFDNIRYVASHYGAVIKIHDATLINTKGIKGFHKKSQEKVDTVLFNPFFDTDLQFVLMQYKDTSALVVIDSINKKISIKDKSSVNEPVILIEKPIFSNDFKQAYIRTSIDYKGGCVGYESYYTFENGKWNRKRIKEIYRC
jgi:hypothetical protein